MSEAELVKRLEKLERDNRRLKRSALAALMLAAVLLAGYAASCSRNQRASGARNAPEKITAHEIDLTDSSGKVRVKMYADEKGATGIVLSDAKGKKRAAVAVDSSGGTAGIALTDAQGEPREMMGVDSSGAPGIWLDDAQGIPRASMAVSSSGNPTIELTDAQGFGMTLGRTSTATPTTGQTQRTSAASIVMFGKSKSKDHPVIWRAP
ncbi:MAG: hypothetical protein ACRD1O_00885 [Terriglobia bacterium]